LFKSFWQLEQGHTTSNEAQDLQKVTKFYWKGLCPRYKRVPKWWKSAQSGHPDWLPLCRSWVHKEYNSKISISCLTC